ncbi:MAG: ferrous iron transport protein A [Oscillospiraceae bacterium]|nr:ferrous iron transport protein A [Oscillospiraceae bacterium]
MDRTLAVLPPGGSGIVRAVMLPRGIRERLWDIGLLPGTRVTCLHIAPAGSPAAYRIRGAVIALRRQDAAAILLE